MQNQHEIAALAATNFGIFAPFVKRLNGRLERYGNRSYGLVTPGPWVTGTKEQVLEAVHQFIVYGHAK